MVAQFQSLLSPFIVLFTIPLAFTGGLLALWITGKELSVIAMLGFLMLAGVVVNNGIVFVDYANGLRLEGMERAEALVQTGRDRIRPILMTAMTTIFGLATMALGLGAGGDMLQPLAIVTIGGLAYATLLTLFTSVSIVAAGCDRASANSVRSVLIRVSFNSSYISKESFRVFSFIFSYFRFVIRFCGSVPPCGACAPSRLRPSLRPPC